MGRNLRSVAALCCLSVMVMVMVMVKVVGQQDDFQSFDLACSRSNFLES
jgi:hypothetical protein